jgi:exonuclease SbcC
MTQINEELSKLELKKSEINKERETAISQQKDILNEELRKLQKRQQDTIEKVEAFAKQEEQNIYDNSKMQKISFQEHLEKLILEKQEKEHLKKEIDDIKEKITNLQNAIINLENDIKRKEQEEYDMSMVNSYEKKIRDFGIHSAFLQKQQQFLNNRLEILTFWKGAFSSGGIPSLLIDEAIPFMNSQVSDYLEKLTNGRYIVSFDTQSTIKSGELRDKILVNVLDTFTKGNSRVQLSGGQTRIIDIATILTLGDLQTIMQDISLNILLFDEIFDALDEENIGAVCKVLQILKKTKTIWLVSHKYEDQVEADDVLTFK